MSEATPLLVPSNASGGLHANDAPDATSSLRDAESARESAMLPLRFRVVVVATCTSLVLSTVILADFIAITIVMTKFQTGAGWRFILVLKYSVAQGIKGAALSCIVATIFAIANLRLLYREKRTMWLGPNLIVDVALVYSLVVNCFMSNDVLAGDWAYCHVPQRSTYDERQDFMRCLGLARKPNDMIAIGFGSCLILAVIHLVLATKRWLEVFRGTGRGGGLSVSPIPGGQFNIGFIINYPGGESSRAGSDSAAAPVVNGRVA